VIKFYLKGTVSQALTVAPSSSAVVNLAPGRYQFAAEIPDSGTVPLYAELNLKSGTQYRQLFYVSEPGRQ
jgi:hypothetical protein